MILPRHFESDWDTFARDVAPDADPVELARLKRAFFCGALALASQLSFRCDAALVDLTDRVKAMGREEEAEKIGGTVQ